MPEKPEPPPAEVAAPPPEGEVDRRPVDPDPLATYDLLGRKQPHNPFTPMHIFRMQPKLVAAFKRRVPEEMIERRQERGELRTTFACVCGHGHEMTKNSLANCPCGRWFFSGVQEVLVAKEEPNEQETAVVN